MARIIVTTSLGDQTYELVPGQMLTVGRDPANKLPLPGEAGLSRRHCRIGPREGAEAGWEVADLGSTNKTRVNGHQIQAKALTSGDVIEIGSVKIRFEDPEEEERLKALGREGVCYLEWVSGDHKGERIVLSRKRTTVGRRDACDVTLDDRMVSGHHAEIDRDLNGYTIRDLGSTNGTLVNGQPVSEALLTHGSRVRIGNARFAFKDPSMKDIEVELAHFEEDEGWGMMGEIDLSRAHGSRTGIVAVVLLFLAAGVGGFLLSQRGEAGTTGAGGGRAGYVENGDFESEDLTWSADREDGVQVRRVAKGGRPDGWLSMQNTGEAGSGVVHVYYDRAIETAGSRGLVMKAQVRGGGSGGAELVATWASDPTAEELKAGVTALERSDLLAAPGGGWTSVDTRLLPPPWARNVHLGVRLPPGASAGLDAVYVASTGEPVPRVTMDVRSYKAAYLDGQGALELVEAGRRILLTGVRPIARLPGGEVLEAFEPDGAPEGDERSASVKGVLRGQDAEVPVSVRWETTGEGLKVEIRAQGVEAVGLAANAPAAHVGGTVSVLGAFAPQRMPVSESALLEQVSRALVGDPGAGLNDSTLIAFAVPGDQPLATLDFEPARDEGLVHFHEWIAGDHLALELTTDFTKQRGEAADALKRAKALAQASPGLAVQQLREIAIENPFEESVRDEALRVAAEIETRTRADVDALKTSLEDYRIYGSNDALEQMEKQATALAALFLGEPGRGGTFEPEIADLVQKVHVARVEHEIEQASPHVDRLERIAGLLDDSEGYKPMAALYLRALIHRYESLATDAEDIARRLQAAKTKLEELEQDETVREALPPLPQSPEGRGG